MTRSNIWLSIDWDFFCYDREEWGFVYADHEAFRGSHVWELRAQQLRQLGGDLVAETDLARSNPQPKDFWSRLQGLGYRFTSTKAVIVADSHQWAYNVFRRSLFEGPSTQETRLVHFDAHHDLTYNMLRFEEEAGREHVTCENWQLMTLLSQIGLRSLVVYPEWKGLREWEQSFSQHYEKTPELAHALDRMVEPCVWPSRRVQESAGDVELVYICRSSAWTPPWHDGAFQQFVEALQPLTQIPAQTPFIESEKIDPLEARIFTPGRVMAETEKQYLASIQAQA